MANSGASRNIGNRIMGGGKEKERRKCRVRLYYYLITFIDYGALHCAGLLLCSVCG